MEALKEAACDDARACKEKDPEIFWCASCDLNLCASCWMAQLAHTKGKRHEKVSLQTRYMLQSIMSSTEKKDQSHLDAYGSKWFGVSIDQERKDLTLDITSRYRRLAMMNAYFGHMSQFPALISFVGETGAGKSSLVNALIKVMPINIETPVVGDVEGSDVPTSSDVHLFADPGTRNSSRPYLYADCEGLEGGNADPQALIEIKEALIKHSKLCGLRDHGRRLRRIKILNISGHEPSRDWMVKQFYPRILYTFSDLICYVTRNLRTFEAIVERLIRWADGVFEHSVNQPLLPHAIVIVNAFEETVSTGSWYTTGLTEQLLNKYSDTIGSNPILRRLTHRWRNVGKNVANLKELISCYYSGFDVVCIPHHKMAPGLLLVQQYQKFYETIGKAVAITGEIRNVNGLLWNWNDLEMYLGYAFDHYGQNSNKPFDFLNAAFRHYPVRSNFHTHILMAAIRLINPQTTKMKVNIFEVLAPLVAVCILLDVCRKRLPALEQEVIEKYKKHLENSYRLFYNDHWPCGFVDQKDRKCVNVSTKHHKGHQNAKGKLVAAGNYFNTIDPQGPNPERKKVLTEQLVGYFDPPLRRKSQSLPRRIAAASAVPSFPSRSKHATSDNLSHITCFACLFSPPHHVLSCGHLLCENCVDDCAKLIVAPKTQVSQSQINLSCPFCSKECILRRMPRQAAPRVLCLDGGGVRSVIQLKVLAALEDRIALQIPIQEFFDLIIGTSAGGIVALGLGAAQLPVQDCMKMFRNFAVHAFTKRTGLSIPGLRYLVEAHNHSQFRSSGLKEVLKSVFGTEISMFGEARQGKAGSSSGWAPKVGVTLTASSGHPYLVTNYNRILGPTSENARPRLFRPKTTYGFLRAENYDQELKVWEAALATTAAPRFFKPFHHKATGHVFTDGGLNFINPVAVADRERELLWPSFLHPDPDILLSLGTGFVPGIPEEQEKTPQAFTVPGSQGAVSYLNSLKVIINHQTNHQFNSHRLWDDYMERMGINSNMSNTKTNKYRRLDVPFPSEVPRLHHVNQMDAMEAHVDSYYYPAANSSILNQIAAQLVASLFYLRLDNSTESSKGIEVQGRCI
ncbi:acyl transferase/acyl hydrolase/lysophospholipase [Kalaharituber pfeilii]|nr:acyl transferase/acyl hydrolase/lysophospholipase [Kalaharituber pfeilii]